MPPPNSLIIGLARLLLLLLLLTTTRLCHGKKQQHVYKEGQQFPPGSEHVPFPGSIIAFSIYMGRLRYSYMSLTLESMRLNPMVQFVLVNVVQDASISNGDANELQALLRRKAVPNFHLEVVTMQSFSTLVLDKLHIQVPFNSSWYYKMTDYKPTLAYLFSHLIDEPPPRGLRRGADKPFSHWGYTDTDLVWGNFSRFAHLFQKHTILTSDYQGATGVAMFFKNEPWTRELFRTGDPLYTELLSHALDYQLDEFSRKGLFANVTMDQLISKALPQHSGATMNKGLHWKDKLWLESDGAHTWAGPVRWWRGSLKIVHASTEFPAYHEILIFHRPTHEYDVHKRHSHKVASEIEADMLQYGYLLPNWVPLLTRHLCVSSASDWQPQSAAISKYKPYSDDCFAKDWWL